MLLYHEVSPACSETRSVDEKHTLFHHHSAENKGETTTRIQINLIGTQMPFKQPQSR